MTMNTPIHYISSITLVLFLTVAFIPLVSHAQIEASLTGEADVTGAVDEVLDADVESNTSVSAETNSEEGTDANVNSNNDLEINLLDGDPGNQNGEMADSETDSQTELSVNASGIAVMFSSQIESENDLEVFSSNVSATNENVAKVDIDTGAEGDSEVEVVHKHRGKLFGFIPVTITSTTKVTTKTDGSVEVESNLAPWSFLVTSVNYAKSELESRIRSNATVSANAHVNASARAKAEIAEAVVSEVEAHATAQAVAQIEG